MCLLKAEKTNQMLKQVQHDMQVWFSSLLSSQTCFGISVLGLEFGFKAPPYGRGSLLGSWRHTADGG